MLDYKEVNKEADKNTEEVAKLIPGFMGGFAEASEALNESATLDLVTRELIYLAFSIGKQCEACIGAHVRNYIEAGGKREALADLAGIAIQMQGGPGLTYAGKVIQAFDQLSE